MGYAIAVAAAIIACVVCSSVLPTAESPSQPSPPARQFGLRQSALLCPCLLFRNDEWRRFSAIAVGAASALTERSGITAAAGHIDVGSDRIVPTCRIPWEMFGVECWPLKGDNKQTNVINRCGIVLLLFGQKPFHALLEAYQ